MRKLIAYPYERQTRYPGLRPNDQVIWEEFIRKYPDQFDHVYYDLHLGKPTADEIEASEMHLNGAWDVTQWCIDVVGVQNGVTWIIEVKPNALAGALGQALAYEALAQAEGLVVGPSVPVVLTDTLSPITEEAAKLLGVTVLVP